MMKIKIPTQTLPRCEKEAYLEFLAFGEALNDQRYSWGFFFQVDALRRIADKLHVRWWDFSMNPSSGNGGWVLQSDDTAKASNLSCGRCSITSGTNLCHVVSIQLDGQNLDGYLPPDFVDLPFLEVILLTRNYINGTFPVAWTSLPLVRLELMGNRLSGQIPEEIGNLSALEILHLEGNLFEGPLPRNLGKLTKLTRLILSSNDFVGELPDTLANLKNLKDLWIDATGISGKIPPSIANCTNLQRLYMQGTSMVGPFPSIFSALKDLTDLRVSDLARGGNFPQLRDLPLQYLTLRNCSISGHLPEYIGNMKLTHLDLSFNYFTGEIPSAYAGLLPTIKNIYLTNNMLNGTVYDWISGSNQNIDLSFNSFMSSVPDGCQQGNVNFFGSCSSSNSTLLPACSRKNYPCPGDAENHDLHINCGGKEVIIGGHKYEDDSSAFGTSSNFLSENKNWAYSSTGDFTDTNSNSEYTIKNTSVLNITDDIDLYMSARVSPLSLRYYGLCLRNGKYTVTLHFAEITFTDDRTFSSVGRRFFDVSIQGQKVLRSFNIAKEAGGSGRKVTKSFNANVEDNTLEVHFQWAGKGTTAIPSRGVYGPVISAISVTSIDHGGDKKHSVGIIIGIVAVSSILIAFAMLLLFSIRKKYHKNIENKEVKLQSGKFSLKQINSATSNFDPINKIGEGGFGPVYKGMLHDGSLIAVKQLSNKSQQGNREFINEIGMIYALQHPNVVKLYGCCMEENQLFLIYEYLENNSLSRALFGPEEMRLQLNWRARHKICLGIARGLAYMHEESQLKIVHRDIKSSNILLDKDLNAKISDFGLARLHEGEDSHISTRIAGTVGYMAPEYAIRGYLTEKVDVYSFGVVVLEVMSGKSNASFLVKENIIHLLDWAMLLCNDLWYVITDNDAHNHHPLPCGTLFNERDLSFNYFTGEIPSAYAGLLPTIKNIYLTNNMLNGTVYDWISGSNQNIDLSFNSFMSSVPDGCQQGNVNFFGSCSSSNSTLLPACSRKNYPCPGDAENHDLHINCGGKEVIIGGHKYEDDSSAFGTSSNFLSENKNWAYSSTGDFTDTNSNSEYTIKNTSVLNITDDIDLYMSARVSPLSLRYYGLCLRNGKYTVTLHFAEITFTDDRTFSSVGRRFFDVSIQGQKVLRSFNIAKEAGGSGRKVTKSFNANVEDNTLEVHFQWAGKGTTAIPSRGVYGPVISAISVTSIDHGGDKKHSVGIIIGIVAVSSILIAFAMLLLFSIRKKYHKNIENKEVKLQSGKFSLKQINSATSNFDPINKIGEGGFGPVYKGMLHDGSLIAVKQLSNKSQQGNREFINEIGMIYALQHPNVVKLYGCCMEENQLFLIYEYLENNSLSRALFGPEEMRLQLNWRARHKICLGIARGLAYMHEESQLKIVHRDIKSSNILLDKDLNAKISDFGLARLHEGEDSHISTRIAGTVGYMAPEYAIRGYLTEKVDVYSFGVVVLEVMSGKSNASFLVKENIIHLLDWAYSLEREGDLIELVDPALENDCPKEEARRLLKLAVTCVNPSATIRPQMSTVVSILEDLVAADSMSDRKQVLHVEQWPFVAPESLFDGNSLEFSGDDSQKISITSASFSETISTKS